MHRPRPRSGSAALARWHACCIAIASSTALVVAVAYEGFMHADGYPGFNDLYRTSNVSEVACMAHVRRKFVDVHKSLGSAIAEEAIKRIAKLYGIEKEVRCQPPEMRVKARQSKSKPIFDILETWLQAQLPKISGMSVIETFGTSERVNYRRIWLLLF